MNYLDLSIKEIHEALLAGKVTPLELTKEALARAKQDNNNAFEYICEKEALEQAANLSKENQESLLWGIPYVLKDNFSTKDIPTCGSSDILKGYVPIYSSEVYDRLTKAGAILIGKTTLDELAMGGTGMSGHLGYTYNPWDPSHTHMVGGSSCGSAACCANNVVPFAIGSDTGDSIRKPASHAGLVGIKPTWGRISRFGLFPFAPSMDHVGYFTRNVEDSATLLDVLAGRDVKDATSSNRPVEEYTKFDSNKSFKLCYIKEILDSLPNGYVKDAFATLISNLKSQGVSVEEAHMDVDLCRAIFPTYLVISCSEATSNNANLDGIKFGPRYDAEDYEDVMKKARTNGFSELIKRRFVIGSYSLYKENQNEVFLRAQKCRRLIVDATNEILSKYDGILLPAAPSTAPLFVKNKDAEVPEDFDICDNFMAIGNFGGYPSITLPIALNDNMPFGVNLTCKPFDEVNLFNISTKIENVTGLKGLSAKGGNK